ncbi:hypothetical protein AB0M05_29780 [Streptomyces violaceusniger]|uniref:hypothetical protein n=1 Tax=Streptomyces violaceusniger TaxID=68280 RepID=UPI003431ED17
MSLPPCAGRITYTREGCGGEPDSKGKVMPYIEGKRCWLNGSDIPGKDDSVHGG